MDNVTTVYERQSNWCTGLHRRGERKLASLDVVVYLPRSLLHSGQKNREFAFLLVEEVSSESIPGF
jgi:hypothetical protein